jgi:hypothetical protein
MDDKTLEMQSNDAHILTGDKSAKFGGGPSPYGFVISGSKVVGYVNLQARKLMDADWLIIKP